MKLLPYDKFCISTPLKPAEVEQRLQAEVAPNTGWGLKAMFADIPNTYFKGVAQDGHFKFMRIVSGRNSFVPVVNGHTESWPNGSMVYVKMRLQIPVAIFICFWLGAVGIVCLLMLVVGTSELIKGASVNASALPALIPFIMFVAGYAMTIGFYSSERNKAKEILLQILEGQIDETTVYAAK